MQTQDLIEIYDRGDESTKYSVGSPVLLAHSSAVFSLLRRDGQRNGFMWLDLANIRKVRFGTRYLRQYHSENLAPVPDGLDDAALESVIEYLLDGRHVCAIDDLDGNETLGIIRHFSEDFITLQEIQDGTFDGEALLPMNQVGEVRFGGPVHEHLSRVQ
ncbi:MAG TPA: hypothetical protein PKA27_16645 [Fimbriimonadaceae bacterium]|nr:hypothetical protein [Fimbriimonadaceae bacterium]